MNARWALTREVSRDLQDALLHVTARGVIDIALARRQHAAYLAALRDAGVAVTLLPELRYFPDCCFVEDCAVIAGGAALVTRLGASSRQGEESSIGRALAAKVPVHCMTAPATVDGGDVMRVGTTIFVGLSGRTNEAGLLAIARVFEPLGFRVRPIRVPPSLLHLKCACSPVGDEAVLVASAVLDPLSFVGVEVIPVPAREVYAANVVEVNGTVLVPAGFRRTRAALDLRGFKTVELDVSELRKADGSLTCLSLLV